MNLEIIIDSPDEPVVQSYFWSDGQRLPVVGEVIQIGRARFVVTRVEWVLVGNQTATCPLPVEQAALYVKLA